MFALKLKNTCCRSLVFAGASTDCQTSCFHSLHAVTTALAMNILKSVGVCKEHGDMYRKSPEKIDEAPFNELSGSTLGISPFVA